MEKRDIRRIKRRITCEFFHGDVGHKGIVLDLDPAGLFIRTNAVISPDAEIEIHIAASIQAPAMSLLARVARRKFVPANLGSIINRGLGVQLLDAPPEYNLFFAGGSVGDAVRTERSNAGSMLHSRQGSVSVGENASRPPESQPTAVMQHDDEPAPGASRSGRIERISTSPVSHGDRSEYASSATDLSIQPQDSETLAQVTAVLFGGGELNEIADLLVEFGVNVVHGEPSNPELMPLTDARLIVVSARLALSHAIPVGLAKSVSIAVGEEASKTTRTMLGKQGFQYLLSQPVHTEALRLLIRYALFDQPDRRTGTRLPIGHEASWTIGWRRARGGLLDISRDGCRLLSPDSPPMDARIRIKIPSEIAGGKPLKLRGTVVRCSQYQSKDHSNCIAVGVAFDDLKSKVRERLNHVCDLWSTGPPMLAADATAESGRAGKNGPRRSEPAPATRPAAATASSSVHVDEQSGAGAFPIGNPFEPEDGSDSTDRRQNLWGRLDREIVEVDGEQHVVQALLGRDLSMGGIRVDQQPDLQAGDKLQLAIFDQSRREPLILSAVAARDDGVAGLGLHFVDLTVENKARLAEIINALPTVESLGSPGSSAIVPAGILSKRGQNPSS